MDFLSTERVSQSVSESKKAYQSHKMKELKVKEEKLGRHHQPIGPSEVDELFNARDRLRTFSS